MGEDGWIEWTGGECPVAHDEPVAVKWRSGNTWKALAAGFQWHHAAEPQAWDIIAYRLYAPTPEDRGTAETPQEPSDSPLEDGS